MHRESRVRQPVVDKVDSRVARLAASQWSVLSLDELRECGLTRQAVAKRVQDGPAPSPVSRCLRRRSRPPLSRMAVSWLPSRPAETDAVLSHYSAACLWCLLKWDYRDPEVTATNARRHKGIRTHTSDHIERTYRSGIPVTPPLRTLIDLSSMLPYATLRRAVNEALNQRLVKPHELVTANHRGAKQLREVVASGAPTRNEFEDLVHALLGDLPKPQVNQPLLGYVPDFLLARAHTDPRSRRPRNPRPTARPSRRQDTPATPGTKRLPQSSESPGAKPRRSRANSQARLRGTLNHRT